MAGAKLVVIYPRPADADAFERAYTREHVPLTIEKIQGDPRNIERRFTAGGLSFARTPRRRRSPSDRAARVNRLSQTSRDASRDRQSAAHEP